MNIKVKEKSKIQQLMDREKGGGSGSVLNHISGRLETMRHRMGSGKGSNPRNCFSQNYKKNIESVFPPEKTRGFGKFKKVYGDKNEK